jgi:serine/threonine protein kinase
LVNPATEPTPEQFGPYEVHERLGMGGMATVCRAKKRGPAGFERNVALKRMLSNLAEDQHFVESFIREAKVASLLQHPNIAQVYDFGRISGVYYIAMELVAGFDVRRLLRYANRSNEAIPLPVLLSILGELCEALDYAHMFVDEAGQPLNIVHRDVSPSNLIVAHTGHLKVIDFGIAKASSRQLHTESGHVKGKLGYMSPEAALGMQIGPVSDIFSVGVVAWELATALPLFSARTDFETMRKIREQPILPPSKLNPSIPPKLDELILASLHRDPDQRLASASLFRAALDTIASTTKTHVSARGVADWMQKFVQPDDAWARQSQRAKSPSGRTLPLPDPAPVTAVLRTGRPHTLLNRSPDDIQLATEIWGDDVRTVEDMGPLPDFHRHVATPLPTQLPSSVLPPPLTTASLRPSRKPLLILAALSLIAGVLGAVLYRKHQAVEPAAMRFQIEPGTAQVTFAGKPIDHAATLELAPGVYPMNVELDGYKPWSSDIMVREGDQQTIRVALDKADTEIAIVPPPQPEPVAIAEPAPTSTLAPERSAPKPSPKQPTKRVAKVAKGTQVAEVETPKLEPEPKVEPPKPEPPKLEPPKLEPPKPEKPVETKPARTPVVAANAVAKLSGDVPTLHAKNAEGSGDVLAKMCIDEKGRVSSVKIVKSNPEIATQLQSALTSWRYKPYTRDGKPTPVCFPLSLRVVVKS